MTTATRITIPTGSIAIILPAQLADELMTLVLAQREASLKQHQRLLARSATDDAHLEPAYQAKTLADVWGDVALALLVKVGG